jgi:hypothetical protein
MQSQFSRVGSVCKSDIHEKAQVFYKDIQGQQVSGLATFSAPNLSQTPIVCSLRAIAA